MHEGVIAHGNRKPATTRDALFGEPAGEGPTCLNSRSQMSDTTNETDRPMISVTMLSGVEHTSTASGWCAGMISVTVPSGVEHDRRADDMRLAILG
jgi:hypothetical protein